MGSVVVVISLVVGAATYAVTIRAARREPTAIGFDAGARPSAGATAMPLHEREAPGKPRPPAPAGGPGAAPQTDTELAPGYTYLQVSTRGPSWRDRVAGVVGLAVILVVGSVALALAVYGVGHALNGLVQRFLNG
jgi:hypothetical protein